MVDGSGRGCMLTAGPDTSTAAGRGGFSRAGTGFTSAGRSGLCGGLCGGVSGASHLRAVATMMSSSAAMVTDASQASWWSGVGDGDSGDGDSGDGERRARFRSTGHADVSAEIWTDTRTALTACAEHARSMHRARATCAEHSQDAQSMRAPLSMHRARTQHAQSMRNMRRALTACAEHSRHAHSTHVACAEHAQLTCSVTCIDGTHV